LNDDQFDDIAKRALAFETGPPREAAWARVRPVPWTWLPTVREILVCGVVCALALGLAWLRIGHSRAIMNAPNPVVQQAMHDETRFVLNSVRRISGVDRIALSVRRG